MKRTKRKTKVKMPYKGPLAEYSTIKADRESATDALAKRVVMGNYKALDEEEDEEDESKPL